ncbi:hypothetical protein OIE52_39545 [Streptomyces canus]|uniref:hypothetical protein n=1 Tax=Streptomyces canus TaxID=58343 RepID=UPI0032461F86
MPKTTAEAPTPEEIREAARRLQRGGILGRGNADLATKVVQQAEEAGLDGQQIAGQILGAAADYKPHWWAR